MRPLRLWPAAVMSVLAVLIMIGSGVVAAGINPFPSVSASVATAPTPAVNPSAAVMPAAITPSAINPSGAFCNWVLGAQPLVIYQLLGPSCAYSALEAEVVQVDAANANISANNIITALGNYENMSAAATANVNATFQELLSYYEGRAEAIAAEYVGQNWSNLTYTTILDESGLTSSIEGMEFALADQQYQIWNATAASWNTAFGFGGQFASAVYAAFQLPIGSGAHGPGYSITSSDFIAGNGYSFNASYPYERWGLYGFPHDSNLYGISNGSYFNLMPGGTIIEPAICGTTGMYAYLCTETQNATFTIQDLTTGFNYTVPKVSWATYISTTAGNLPPVVSTLDHIGPFDTLRLWCMSDAGNCSHAGLQTTGSYFTVGVTYAPEGYGPDTGVPYVLLVNGANGAGGTFGSTILTHFVPSAGVYACTTDNAHTDEDNICNSSVVYSAGNATSVGQGPGSVVSNNSYFGYVTTAKSLVSNTMVMAYDYWLTLRALTDKGKYVIPANCAVPTPSDAFPTATNFQTYGLNAADVEGVYLAYLNAVARGYGSQFVNGFTNFCNDPNLGLTFNWSAKWNLLLNITASVYIGAPNGSGLYVNGTYDPNASYNNTNTWPLQSIAPILLYPYEYNWNVPVTTIAPIPVNDPMVGLLLNWTQNPGYGVGNNTSKPLWGTPTYIGMAGYGNYTEISGFNSHVTSGTNLSKGDAIYITACVLSNVTQSVCPLSVTYFNNFTYGIVHFIESSQYIKPIPINTGSFLGSGDCGTGALTGSIVTAWMGDVVVGVANALAPLYGIPIIGGALKDIGCFLGWVVLIIIFVGLAYVVFKIAMWALGRSGKRGRAGKDAFGGGSTVNVYTNRRGGPY